jgi:hypothetical protein
LKCEGKKQVKAADLAVALNPLILRAKWDRLVAPYAEN